MSPEVTSGLCLYEHVSPPAHWKQVEEIRSPDSFMSLCRLHCSSCLSVQNTITRHQSHPISLPSAASLDPIIPSYSHSHMQCSFIAVSTWKCHESYSRCRATEELDDSSISDTSVTAFYVRVHCFSLRKSTNKCLGCRCYKMFRSRLSSFQPMRIRPPWRYADGPIGVIRTNGCACDKLSLPRL